MGGIALLVAGCSAAPSKLGDGSGLSAKVASFDLVAGKPQRFQVALVDDADRRVLVGGTVELSFMFLGTADRPEAQPGAIAGTTAVFVPLAGEPEPSPSTVSRFATATAGVYRTTAVTFPDAGFWRVSIDAETPAGRRDAAASFEVAATSLLPRSGDLAPLTDNAVLSTFGVDPATLDSRADFATPVPDPELHATSIAAAIAAGQPVIVVVATPSFCQSRFCGPITESVARLARAGTGEVAFVHLEVWEDFDANRLNPYAQEWIDPSHVHVGNEPWVFVIDHNGVIVERFDNVASDRDLSSAVSRLRAAASLPGTPASSLP